MSFKKTDKKMPSFMMKKNKMDKKMDKMPMMAEKKSSKNKKPFKFKGY